MSTAVDLFTAAHEAGNTSTSLLCAHERFIQPCGTTDESRHESRHESRYRSRLPLHAPDDGQQYAFQVDLDACTGCKACVSACHSLNGLDDDETWRKVGALSGLLPDGRAEQRTVTTACHHCVDPACLRGCPVNAYEKDPRTGIVVHLDDQCIGCSYCTMTCPYDVPQLNERLGIVRKCDMCRGRLDHGEAPACVQGCPNGAITITVVRRDDVRDALRNGASRLVPDAPLSSRTTPTTTYLATAAVESLRADDVHLAEPAPAHTPLAVMLVLTQAAAGLAAVDALALVAGHPQRSLGVAALACVVAGITASAWHLGRPAQAWRVVLGIGHSWLSREAVALAAFAGATALRLVLPSNGTALAAALTGFLAVLASTAVYTVTGRTWWSPVRVASRFASGVCAGGAAIAVPLLQRESATGGTTHALGWLAACALGVGLLAGRPPSRTIRDTALRRTASLLAGACRPTLRWQRATAAAAAVLIALGATSTPTGSAAGASAMGALVALVSLLLERALFFRAVAPDRMPGGA